MTTDSTDEADREALRSYLLGVLPSERQEAIDERLVIDEEFHAELKATADDLIHAYLAGELSDADYKRFQTHFLASPRRRARMEFLSNLLAALDRHQASTTPPRTRRSSLMAMLPWAAVLVVGLAGGGWSVREKRLHERELTAARGREDALRQRLEASDQRMRELDGRGREASDEPEITTWRLQSGVERAAAPTEPFTVRASLVRLRVPLDDALRLPSYRASLHSADGKELLRVRGLYETSGPEGRVLDVPVPARSFRPGAYVLSIQRDAPGSQADLAATTFLVQ